MEKTFPLRKSKNTGEKLNYLKEKQKGKKKALKKGTYIMGGTNKNSFKGERKILKCVYQNSPKKYEK